MNITENEFKAAMAKFASGIGIITTEYESNYYGFTASAICSLSLKPPLLLFCMNKASNSWHAFNKSSNFAISILSSHQEVIARNFAMHKPDKFSGINYFLSAHYNLPIIDEALCWIECEKYNQFEAGDHSIFIGLVSHMTSSSKIDQPLIHFNRNFFTVSL